MGAEAAAALELAGVAKQFGGHAALARTDLAIARGECLVLIGESGSGKSTVLRLLNRLLAPDSGEVRHNGRSIAAVDPVSLRRAIGYVPQDGGLLPHWTVARNVGLVPRLLEWDSSRVEARCAEMLRFVDLDPTAFGRRYPRTLSGGQRQRVAIARALAADPSVVLLDEPFGALDALSRDALRQEFRRWRASLEKTIVLVTHDLTEAFQLGDRVAVLRAGQIEQIATPTELRARPATEYVARLLAVHFAGGVE